jgi:hypothetical protein
MGSWLDRWAKRAAASPAPSSPAVPPPHPADDESRRSFLKKAAVVTGAVWTVPILQTALAPAASASAGAVIGSPCSPDGVVCGDTSVCAQLICGGAGATCTGGQPCFNSQCSGGVCGGVGAKCNAGKVCAPGLYCRNPGQQCYSTP